MQNRDISVYKKSYLYFKVKAVSILEVQISLTEIKISVLELEIPLFYS